MQTNEIVLSTKDRETKETKETMRPREDSIKIVRDLTVVSGSQGHKKKVVIKF